MAVSVKFQRLS